MAESSEIEWKPRQSEKAVFGGMQFDLIKAKELIKATPRPIESKPPSVFKPMYYLMDIKIDWEKAKQADMKVPIIAINHEGQALIIDGWHRYAYAVRNNLPEVPVVMLTDEEAKQVRTR